MLYYKMSELIDVIQIMPKKIDGKKEEVKELLKSGVDPNIQDRNGGTALIYAARTRGYIDIVKILLENGADPNIQDNDGVTALMLASVERYPKIIKLLLENGADPNIQDDEGVTALMLAALWLASSPARVNSRAPVKEYTEIIKILLENDADPDIQDDEGQKPLDNPQVQQIYSEYILSKLLVSKQRLAFAKMMIDPKHKDTPNDVIIKILKMLKVPSLTKETIEILTLKQKLQEELQEEIKKELRAKMSKKMYGQLKSQFPREDVSDMIEFYRKQLRNPNLTPEQRKAYKRQKRTRKRKLGIRTGTSDQSSSRKSRSLRSSEELDMAIKMSVQEAKTGSKKKKKSKKK